MGTKVLVWFLDAAWLKGVMVTKVCHDGLGVMGDCKDVINIAEYILPILVPIWFDSWMHPDVGVGFTAYEANFS